MYTLGYSALPPFPTQVREVIDRCTVKEGKCGSPLPMARIDVDEAIDVDQAIDRRRSSVIV